MAAAARRQPSAVPASSTPSVCPVMGTGVNDRWIEIWASSAHEAGGPDDQRHVPDQRAGEQVGQDQRTRTS